MAGEAAGFGRCVPGFRRGAGPGGFAGGKPGRAGGSAACGLSGGTAWPPDCRARSPAGRLGPNIRLVPRITTVVAKYKCPVSAK